MVSTFSPNLGLEEPANGDYSGTWGSAVINPNMTILDSVTGGTQTIDLSAGSVVLSTTQARSFELNFKGSLPGNVTVTVPTLVSTGVSGYAFAIQNLVSNSSVYTVTIISTVAASQGIGIPPFEIVDIMVEGTGSTSAGAVKFRNLGRVGSYWDYGGSSVPAWVAACTVPPYLNCDGTTFSSATYPALANCLGGTTLPDSRGRYRATLNQGQSRITSGASTGGLDGNTILTAGGSQTQTLSSQNVPPVPIAQSSHSHAVSATIIGVSVPGAGAVPIIDSTYRSSNNQYPTSPTTITITGGSTTPTNFPILPPSFMGGLTLIRAG